MLSVLLLLAAALPASASHEDRPDTSNLHPMGHIEEPRSGTSIFDPTHRVTPTSTPTWPSGARPPSKGSWFGFNIRDISAPGNPKHILGDAMLAACAGGNGFTVLELDPANLDDPQVLVSVDVNDDITDDGVVSIGHSTAFSWDGEVMIFGHEPGGGIQARCQEHTPDSEKSAFFYEPRTGEFLGMWTLPRPQGPDENCTFHNFNVVPLRSGDRVFVHGSYQSGTGVVDFNDPANAVEIAWSDPAPLPVPQNPIFCLVDGAGCELGGAWTSYWYNNFIYESDITEGLNIFRFSGRETAGAMRLPHLNPQTQEFTIP